VSPAGLVGPPCRPGTNVYRWERADDDGPGQGQAQQLVLPPRGDNLGQGRAAFYAWKGVQPGK
jgi:hypothetical protein